MYDWIIVCIIYIFLPISIFFSSLAKKKHIFFVNVDQIFSLHFFFFYQKQKCYSVIKNEIKIYRWASPLPETKKVITVQWRTLKEMDNQLFSSLVSTGVQNICLIELQFEISFFFSISGDLFFNLWLVERNETLIPQALNNPWRIFSSCYSL